MSTGPRIYCLSANTISEMEIALEELKTRSMSRCAFVLDRTGCILASTGDFYPLSPETMGAIAAGAIAALNNLVAQASSREVSVRFYGAEIDRIHFALLAERLILTLVHPHNTGTGPVREAVKDFVAHVRPIVERDQTQPDRLGSVQFIEDKLDNLFRDIAPPE